MKADESKKKSFSFHHFIKSFSFPLLILLEVKTNKINQENSHGSEKNQRESSDEKRTPENILQKIFHLPTRTQTLSFNWLDSRMSPAKKTRKIEEIQNRSATVHALLQTIGIDFS